MSITVAPGIVVSAQEYEERFGGLDLDAFRRSMTPEVFDAYVRFLGVIPGNRNLDVVALCRAFDE